MLLGLAQFLNQLAPFADIDPAADDALYFAQRVAVWQDPVVDGHFAAFDPQRPIDDQWGPGGHDLQVIGLDLVSMFAVSEQALLQALAHDLFAAGLNGFQVAVVATLQATLAITHVHGVRCAVEQRTHECQLVVQRPLGALTLLDLQAQAGIPDQCQQQQQPGTQQHLPGEPAKALPGAVVMQAVTTPAVVDHPQFFRRNAQQRFVEDRYQRL
ncbi:hypothetical protein D3C79_748850 [compost metagenome]